MISNQHDLGWVKLESYEDFELSRLASLVHNQIVKLQIFKLSTASNSERGEYHLGGTKYVFLDIFPLFCAFGASIYCLQLDLLLFEFALEHFKSLL